MVEKLPGSCSHRSIVVGSEKLRECGVDVEAMGSASRNVGVIWKKEAFLEGHSGEIEWTDRCVHSSGLPDRRSDQPIRLQTFKIDRRKEFPT